MFNASQIADLPNPGNDLTNLAQTAPGAVMNTQKTGVGGSGNFSTCDLPATSNLFTLDGMDGSDPVFNVNVAGATGLMLGLNEVQEATVINNGNSNEEEPEIERSDFADSNLIEPPQETTAKGRLNQPKPIERVYIDSSFSRPVDTP